VGGAGAAALNGARNRCGTATLASVRRASSSARPGERIDQAPAHLSSRLLRQGASRWRQHFEDHSRIGLRVALEQQRRNPLTAAAATDVPVVS